MFLGPLMTGDAGRDEELVIEEQFSYSTFGMVDGRGDVCA